MLKMMRRRLSLALLVIATPFIVLGWLLFTQSGLQATAAMLVSLSGEKLKLSQVSGRLSDRMQIGSLHWQDASLTLDVKGAALQWSPLALLHGTLDIRTLSLGAIDITTHSKDEPARMPDSLALPLAVRIAALEIGPLHVNGTLLADTGSAAFASHAGTHVLETLDMRRAGLELHAGGKINTHKPYALALDATLSGKVVEKPFALALKADGSLAHSKLAINRIDGPFSFALQASAQPFSVQLLSALSLEASGLDLAALMPELPQTKIDAVCRMEDDVKNSPDRKFAANCRIDNRISGPIDLGKLPVKQVKARLANDDEKLLLTGLEILSGNGSLKGKLAWSATGVDAKLDAQALDLAALHSRARPSRLSGPITLSGDGAGQQLQLTLGQDRLSIHAELSRREHLLQLQKLELNASAARLVAHGELHESSRDFSLEGKFDHFDPAQFLKAPAGDLNGDFKAHGRLNNAPQLAFSFALRNSRLANAPALGKGHLDLAWPHVRKADLQLDFGQNHARLLGAFGKPGEKLKLDIDAPVLAPYGIEGDFQAHLEAGGRADAPLLNGSLRSTSLRLPGQGRLQRLDMSAEMGTGAEGPLNLRLQFERLDLTARTNAVRKFDLDISGSRRQHQMKLTAQLDDDLPLLVAARGSFADKTAVEWTGALTQLHMDRASSQRFLHLDDEAALAIGSTHWSIGPMRLQSRQAAIKFNANAVAGKMQLALAAENPSIGRASLDLSASPASAWALSAQTPWQGKLQAAIGDLAWVNDLIGSPWQASGRLDADVKIAGTPQFPLINGQISGSQLALRNLDTRMVLQNGTLRASIRDSILMLDEFNADSVLTQPPPALQRTLADKGQSLIEKPGRISAQGRMKLGAMGPGDTEQLRLDVTLDRLGISQTPRQWLLLSGQGKLNWQQAKLGVEAKLGVDAAHWQLADLARPQLSDDVVVHREGNTSTEVRRTTPWTGTVQVGLGRNFSFEGAGARGRLTGQVRVIASAQDLPRASGTVNLVNGRYEAYGQQLDIERGILNFQGLLENPALNILALRKGLPVEAGVEITGFAQAPRIRLVSEPNVPDTEKLSWLVLGRPPSQEGGDAGVLMAAVGAIFGNQSSSASQHIKDSFGIDEISVRSGNIGQMQAMNSRVVSMSSSSQNTGQILAVGKQLSDRLRLSYEQALGGADSLVKLTLKVTEQISVVGTSGTDAALDVFYGFSFGGTPGKTK